MQGKDFTAGLIDTLKRRLEAAETGLKSLPPDIQKEIIASRRLAHRDGHRGLMKKILAVPLPVPGQPQSTVTLVDVMGDDSSVVQAARLSYGKGTKKATTDRGLVRYLLSHAHTTPFEMCEIKLRIDCPIFVARQWIRHRTANVNEYSGRYSEMNDNFYVPLFDALAPQSKSNRQGRAGGYTTRESARIAAVINASYKASFKTYNMLLGKTGKPGFDPLARELARMVLPVGGYTSFYFKIDAHNLMHFLRLRADSHAQKEIRDFAETMEMIFAAWLPTTCEAYFDYIKAAKRVSSMAIQFVNAVLAGGTNLTPAAFGLTDREANDLFQVFPDLRQKVAS